MVLLLFQFLWTLEDAKLPDLAIPHRVVADVTPLLQSSPSSNEGRHFQAAVRAGELSVSDDGKVLFAQFNQNLIVYLLNPLRQAGKGIESIISVVSEKKPWRLMTFSQSQFRYIRPTPNAAAGHYGGRLLGSIAGTSIFCFVGINLPVLQPTKLEHRNYLFGLSEVRLQKRGENPNPTFALPDGTYVRYLPLESRLYSKNGSRFLLARYVNGDRSKGRLEYWLMTETRLVRLKDKALTSEERALDGQIVPSQKPPRGWEQIWNPPDYVETSTGQAGWHGLSLFYDIKKQRAIRLDLPPDDPEGSWKSSQKVGYWGLWLLRGARYFTRWDLEPHRSELHVEERPGVWKYAGPFRLIGRSPNGKYAVIRRFRENVGSARDEPVYVVELLH